MRYSFFLSLWIILLPGIYFLVFFFCYYLSYLGSLPSCFLFFVSPCSLLDVHFLTSSDLWTDCSHDFVTWEYCILFLRQNNKLTLCEFCICSKTESMDLLYLNMSLRLTTNQNSCLAFCIWHLIHFHKMINRFGYSIIDL